MSDIKLRDDTWDIEIVDGDLVFIDTQEVVAKQSILMTMRTYRGEWFRDTTYGVPWIENENNSIAILGKTSKGIFDSYIRGGILYNEEAESIISYRSDKDIYSGKITVTSDILVPNGEVINIEEEI